MSWLGLSYKSENVRKIETAWVILYSRLNWCTPACFFFFLNLGLFCFLIMLCIFILHYRSNFKHQTFDLSENICCGFDKEPRNVTNAEKNSVQSKCFRQHGPPIIFRCFQAASLNTLFHCPIQFCIRSTVISDA